VREPPDEEQELPLVGLDAEEEPASGGRRRLRHDAESDLYEVEIRRDGGLQRPAPDAPELERVEVDRFRLPADDPLSAEVESSRRFALGRDGWDARVETGSRLTSDADAFQLENRIEAYDDGELVFARTYRTGVPRDLL
jgi:hypothetical protein